MKKNDFSYFRNKEEDSDEGEESGTETDRNDYDNGEETDETQSHLWGDEVETESFYSHEEPENPFEEQYLLLKKRYNQLRKHRNEILRDNNELRHQVQMAAFQLAATNRRFSRQMEGLSVQLALAQKVYREKLFECSILDIQLRHMLELH